MSLVVTSGPLTFPFHCARPQVCSGWSREATFLNLMMVVSRQTGVVELVLFVLSVFNSVY